MGSNGFDFDVIVIGSGFGGSVATLRAIEKGYRVGVLESGRRWPDAHGHDADVSGRRLAVRRYERHRAAGAREVDAEDLRSA